MLRFPHLERVRRVLTFFFLAVFLTVASGQAACQVDCLAQDAVTPSGSLAAHDAGTGHPGESGDGSPAHARVRYLTHGGPCHLSATPALEPASSQDRLPIFDEPWSAAPPGAYLSVIWPPPEPRPRT